MALDIANVINLTEQSTNIPPLLTDYLCMANEYNDTNELVQYYITNLSFAEDKATYIEDANYATSQWGDKDKRLTTRAVSRIGVKAFPGIGAIAYFKDKYRGTCNILVPVNSEPREYMSPPFLTMQENSNKLTFTITPPKDIVYFCYRVVLNDGTFAYEYITYDLELTVDKPDVKGTYYIYCTGYVNEGEYTSADSNILTLTITEGRDSFEPISEENFYTKAQIDKIFNDMILSRISALETEITNYDDKEIHDAISEVIENPVID